MKVQNSQNMNIFQDEDIGDDQYSDDDQGGDYEEDYTNDHDDQNANQQQESFDDYQDQGDLLYIGHGKKPSNNKENEQHIFNDQDNDYEFDGQDDYVQKVQKKKGAVNPLNTINASKQNTIAGSKIVSSDKINDAKTSQRVIPDEQPAEQDYDESYIMDQEDKESVELPKPEMTQSPKRTKTNKMNAKISNPPQEVIKQQQIQNEALKSKEGIMNQISQTELNLKPHERKIGQYILGKTIGEGTFGKVKIGMHILTKAKVAVKILEKSKIVDVADVERVSREIHILKIVQHPHVVQLYEIIETQKKLYLIMEYASGGELFDYIVKHQRVQEKEACKFFQQLLSGIEYISRLNIVHRDLKPENLLLDFDKGIKIVDFGLSNTYKTGELLKTACGSPCYAAPEMIAGKKYNGTNVDIWSCGVILFALICGYLPFEDPNTSDLYKKILSADFQTPNYVSDEAKDLFHCILNTDPEKRYTIEQIRKHPWFNIIPCEATFKGIKVGIDPVPIDNSILDRMLADYSIDKNYARKCIQANKHNHISASYYLLLKDLIKRGEKSIADVRSPDYNPLLFVHTAKAVRQERMRDRLENATPKEEKEQGAACTEEEVEQVNGENSAKKAARTIDKDDRDKDINLVRVATENISHVNNPGNRRGSKNINGANTIDPNTTQHERNKSTQPQGLRKIADGLLEFERYADRKKRLQSISQKKKDDDRVKNMNMQLSQNQIAEDMLSNGGGLALLQRGLSPVGADAQTIPGHDTLSFDQGDPNLMFNQNYRDNSPSLSPHSIRINAQKGNMSTQYGNFLYQVEAKQFPNQKGGTGNKNHHQLDQFQLSALKNQMHIQALQASNLNGQNAPNINVNQMNAKQIHKQLKQLYQHQKKQGAGNNKNNGKLTNHEIMLKNLVNMSGDHQSSNLSQASKIHQLQQNYQKQQFHVGKKSGGQNFSTIQTAYDTLQNQQTLMANHHLGKGKKSSGGHTQASMGNQQMGLVSLASGGIMAHHASGSTGPGVPALNSSTPGGGPRPGLSGLHNRYTTQTFNANPAFNTLQQHVGPGNGSGSNQYNNSATGAKHRNNHKYSTHSTFFNPATLQTGSRLGAQSNLQPKGTKRSKNATVTGSTSLGAGGGIFSPKNMPTNSFGFGFGNSMFNSNVTTPQNQPQHSQIGMHMPQQQMFTLESPGTAQNFSNQLMNSLQGGQQPSQTHNQNVMNSLNVNQKQNSQPNANVRPQIGSKKRGSSIINNNNQNLQHSNNTISYAPTQSKQLQDVQSQQSQQSNKALFKRRRDHSKGAQKGGSQNQNKSAQKYQQQYGTIQAGEGTGRGLATGSSQRNHMSQKQGNHSKNNLSINVNNSNKPPLVVQTPGDQSTSSAQRGQPASQKKVSKSRAGGGKNQGRSQQPGGMQNVNDISMKRIIETGQNLANLNLNLNMNLQNQGMGNLAGAVSAKNQNLFSPVNGAAPKQQRGVALLANCPDYSLGITSAPMSPQQQQQLQFQQHQEHLNNLNRIQHQLQLKKQQRANLLNMRNASTNLEVQNNANHSADYQTQSFIQLQQNSVMQDQQSQMSPQNQKVTLNSSLLAQNYAPHLLLQNYHGNGYPPLTQQNLKSPQGANQTAPQQFQNNSGGGPQMGQSSIKTTQSRRKTPQIHTAGQLQQQAKLAGPSGQHLSQTPNSQGKQGHGSLQNSVNNNFINNYSNNIGANQKWNQHQQQNQQQFPLSAKNSHGNPNNYQQFGGGNASGLAPIPLDSSNIDYQDDVMDISNNTIANINQQLGGSKTHILQQPAQSNVQPAQATSSVRKKSRGEMRKKRSVV